MYHQYYEICCKHKGKVVTIYEKCGKVHVGRIVHVDQTNVYLLPTSGGVSSFGYGYPGWGWGWGWGYGYGVPIALAAIGGFALGAAFFW